MPHRQAQWMDPSDDDEISMKTIKRRRQECRHSRANSSKSSQQQRIESAAANWISSSNNNCHRNKRQKEQQPWEHQQRIRWPSNARHDKLYSAKRAVRTLFSERYSANAIQRTLFSERYSAKNAVCKSPDNERQNADVVHVLTPNANAVCVLAIPTSKVVESNSIKHH